MALIVLLSLRFPVGGFVGMSGWMPFRHDIEDLASSTDDDEKAFEDDDVVFGSGDDDNSESGTAATPQKEDEQQQQRQGMRDPVVKVLEYVTDMLSIESGPAILHSRADTAISTPVFLGHGGADDKIRPALGEEACRAMRAIGFDVTWKLYNDQGHWYKVPDEIDDVVEFIRTSVGWDIKRGQ